MSRKIDRLYSLPFKLAIQPTIKKLRFPLSHAKLIVGGFFNELNGHKGSVVLHPLI